MVAQIVDNGSTAVTRAGRIDRRYEDKGIIKTIFNHLGQWAAKEGVNTLVSTSRNDNLFIETQSMKLQEPLLIWHGLDAIVEVQNIVSRSDDINNTVPLQLVTNKFLSTILNTRKIREYIAPNGVMAINWVPLRPQEDNIPFIRGPEGTVTTCVLSDLYEESGKYKGLLSIATVFPTLKGGKFDHVYCIDIHGNDGSCLEKHILRHLLEAKTRVNGFVCFRVFFSLEIDFNEAKHVFSKCVRDIEGVAGSSGQTRIIVQLQEFWRRKETEL